MKLLNTLYILFFSVNALALAIAGVLNGVNWGDYTPTQKVLAMCLIAGSFSNTMLALVITLAKREAQGKPMIPTDDTGQWTKQQFQPTAPPEPQTPKQETK